MKIMNRQITLARRPSGLPDVADFQLVYAPIPPLAAGQVLVRSVYLSLDPYMRGRMNDAPSYAPPLALGEVMMGGAVGIVVESLDDALEVGDAVLGQLGWQEYAVVPAHELQRIDRSLAPISTALGVLGMPGLTAYFGMLDLCDPKPGETVVVSGAAGAVGTVAGQIAKIKGCRVIGIAGCNAKINWLLDELGFDGAINYKTIPNLAATLGELCPQGINAYFDNVGGTTSDAVFGLLADSARIAVCGQISQYNLDQPEMGPRWLGQLVVKQARVQGFLVSSYSARFPEAITHLSRWLEAGEIKYREDIAHGIEAAPQVFIGMLQGKNQGKQLVQVSEG